MICSCIIVSDSPLIGIICIPKYLLNQVEDGYSIANRREKMGAIWTEEQVALTVDGTQQVRELNQNH